MDFERKTAVFTRLSPVGFDRRTGATLSQAASQVDCGYFSGETEFAGRCEVLAVAIRGQNSSGGFV